MIKKFKLGEVAQRIITLVICVAVLVYAIYHVISLFGEDIATITTGISTEMRVVDGKGYVFRNETPLVSSHSGVADYLKEDGSKVSVNEALAEVRAEGDSADKKLIRYYDDRIEILTQSVHSGLTLANLPQVNENINDAYYSLAKMIAGGDTGGISEQADKLLLNMNVHSLLTDEKSVVDNTLERMISEREGMLDAGGDAVVEYASDSGYFYSYTDGFEEYFTLSAADSITSSEFYRLTQGGVSADKSIISSSYGKLSESSEWRFVIRMNEVPAGYFKTGESYKLSFVENGNKLIPMTLLSSVKDADYGGRIFVFSANRLPEGFIFDRCQSVSIEVGTSSGIYVPRTAVHRMGGEYYVYVLKGSVVTMRKLDVLYEGADYYLSAYGTPSDSSVAHLDTNELLIVSGSNLFDGRILD